MSRFFFRCILESCLVRVLVFMMCTCACVHVCLCSRRVRVLVFMLRTSLCEIKLQLQIAFLKDRKKHLYKEMLPEKSQNGKFE